MRAVDILRKKRDGFPLTPTEIAAFVAGATGKQGERWPDYQVSALLMAIVCRGMDRDETAALTHAMVHSGLVLDWSDLPGTPVDKHSSGGVGDKTSPILVPLAAACGVLVPKMSGRGLGHTGGTLDKLEAIPGFRIQLSLAEIRAALVRVGCVIVSPTADIAPADKALYALRDVTATVESIPLIAASIMSKKLAEGIRALVLDVKCGAGAFMKTHDSARDLATALVGIGQASGVRTQALITDMEAPLGRMVGNALEIREAIDVLAGHGPDDLRDLAVTLAARLVYLGGKASDIDEAHTLVQQALTSGRGLEKFREMITCQGGNPRVLDEPALLPDAPGREILRATRSGILQVVHAEQMARGVVLLGAGRDRAEDAIDLSVGAVLLARPGEQVRAGQGLVELHYRATTRLAAARELCLEACVIGDTPIEERPRLLEVVAA